MCINKKNNNNTTNSRTNKDNPSTTGATSLVAKPEIPTPTCKDTTTIDITIVKTANPTIKL